MAAEYSPLVMCVRVCTHTYEYIYTHLEKKPQNTNSWWARCSAVV